MRLAMLKPGLDIMSGYSLLDERGPKHSATWEPASFSRRTTTCHFERRQR